MPLINVNIGHLFEITPNNQLFRPTMAVTQLGDSAGLSIFDVSLRLPQGSS